MILRLSEHLDVPLRERNLLLLAGGQVLRQEHVADMVTEVRLMAHLGRGGSGTGLRKLQPLGRVYAEQAKAVSICRPGCS